MGRDEIHCPQHNALLRILLCPSPLGITMSEDEEQIKMEQWIKDHYPMAKSSFHQYLSIISKFKKEYGEPTYENFVKFVLATNPKTGQLYTTAIQRKRALEIYCDYLGRKDIVNKARDEGIFKRIRLPKALIHPKIFASDDFVLSSDGKFHSPFFDRFKAFIDSLEPDARMLMMILWDTASRISPILRLRKKDIIYNSDGTAEFYITGKGGKKYKLYLSAATAEALKEYSKDFRDDQLLFFRNVPIKKHYKVRDKMKLSYGSYYMELKHKSARAELVSRDFGISPHWIRAAKAHYIYRKEGNDILAVKAYLHHSNVLATEKYLTSDEEELAREIAMKEKNEKWD